MKMSQYYLPTVKDIPADAEVKSHQLMLRAGMIRKVASGIYAFLPLGYNVYRKVENIVREEMERANALEVHLPLLHPAQLWKQSGRWDDFGPLMIRLKDRRQNEYCIGPTHEEVITDMIKGELRSYKSLPVNLFQIQTKVRDEIRPRFGLMRAREFSMKDAYSFHRNEKCLDEGFQNMYKAYQRIFKRLGLDFKVVEADSGAIGGSGSKEFMVLAQSGEDEILYCENCSYGANTEKASSLIQVKQYDNAPSLAQVYTPQMKTIKDLSEFLAIKADQAIKTIVFKGEQGLVLAILRGSDQVNPVKVRNVLNDQSLEIYEGEIPQMPMGFVGPCNLPQKALIVADPLVMEIGWGVCGANKKDYHLIGVKPSRDIKADFVADIRLAEAEQNCPQCSTGKLQSIRGIEVGHIFKLGTKYSEALNANFIDESGQEHPMEMGCYGIGVSRTVAASIEQNHDEYGIIWPLALAPFQISLLSLGNDEQVNEFSQEIYKLLLEQGFTVLWDERRERPGVKFNDADLIGLPLRITIGHRALANNEVELMIRHNRQEYKIPKEDLMGWVLDFFKGQDI